MDDETRAWHKKYADYVKETTDNNGFVLSYGAWKDAQLAFRAKVGLD